MTSRERCLAVLTGQGSPDRSPLWIGNPHKDTLALYFAELGVDDMLGLYRATGNDMVHVQSNCYEPAENRAFLTERPGFFRDCEDPSMVDDYPWPDLNDLKPERLRAELTTYHEAGFCVIGGIWASVFTHTAALFGLEHYLVKMHTHPEVVEAVTQRVVEIYERASRIVFDAVGDLYDAHFFGSDTGTQQSMMISPEHFERFVLPGFRCIIRVGKDYGKPVIVHNCGAISPAIQGLIEAGMDGLNPLQALAPGMDAASLASAYGDRIAYIGGVDTQELLRRGTPDDVRREVRRLKETFPWRFIVSPSHETLLPDIPVDNFIAMCEAAAQ